MQRSVARVPDGSILAFDRIASQLPTTSLMLRNAGGCDPVKIHPYLQVDDFAFSTTQQDLVAHRGVPLHSSRNSVGLTEMDYGDSVFRFQDCGRLEEITKRAPVVQLPHATVPFQFLHGFVLSQDSDNFERAGFVVSPMLGLAFVPASPDWVTALARHCIETWRSLR